MNSPLNKLQQLMVLTMEESGELTQICSKMIRKYGDQKEIEEQQRKLLIEEAGDVYCMIKLMVEHDLMNWDELEKRVKFKNKKLKVWSDLIN